MKTLPLLVLATMPLTGFSQSQSTDPRLLGIVDVENLKLAIVQTTPPRSLELTFTEGQREGGKDGGFEVFAINSTTRSVTAKFSIAAQPTVLTLGATNQYPGITLEEVSLQTILNLFAAFSDRTVLQHPRLPTIKFTVASAVSNRNEAAQILKNALSEKRIAVVPDGSKFLLIAPEEMLSALKPHSAATNTNALKAELIPSGSLNFSSAPLGNVLMIYAEFLGGKLDRSGPPPRDGKVFLKMQTALTKEECLYAFETLVGWHGIKLVSTETGLFKAVATD